jgi:UDP-hydrolysing UDP-N-acetyl-D-glucosamine 2-epimerase
LFAKLGSLTADTLSRDAAIEERVSPEGRRNIAVVSTSRADYGLLYWVLRGLADSPRANLQLILTGAHFSRRHGASYQVVRADGFRPAAQIRAIPRGDTDRAITRSVGELTSAIGASFARLKPDLVVVLGDRYELLAVGAAATIFRLPIAHIHGGESTEGAIDEAVRHAMTKLSHLHLVAMDRYARRVARMGEERWRIRTVGAPGLDHLTRTKLPDLSDVLEEVGLPRSDGRPLFVVTHHPITLNAGSSRAEARAVARAISSFDARVVVTAPNADPEHRAVFREMRSIRSPRNSVGFVANLGTAAYWSLLRSADVVVGNSSSGLLEAPSFGTPVVNVGDRQRGRPRAANVIDVKPSLTGVRAGISKALSASFRRTAAKAVNPYGKGGASERIVRILVNEPLGRRLITKRSVEA